MGQWSFVLIPDTQYLCVPASNLGGFLNGARDWILNNQASRNIKFVAHLGDIVNNGDRPAEWTIANAGLKPLLNAGIPVMFAPGNHDGDQPDSAPRFYTQDFTAFNTHFGPSTYTGKPWFGGLKNAGSATNAYSFVTAGNHDYLLVQIDFYAGVSALEWLRALARSYPTRRVIVITHAFLLQNGQRMLWDSYLRTKPYPSLGAEEMWDPYGALRRIPNLYAIFNGHFGAAGGGLSAGETAYRVDTNDYGRKILQGFYNWQFTAQGGRGRVVLMTVDDTDGSIRQQIVRTDLDTFETGTAAGYSQFSFDAIHDVGPLDRSELPVGTYASGQVGGASVASVVRVGTATAPAAGGTYPGTSTNPSTSTYPIGA